MSGEKFSQGEWYIQDMDWRKRHILCVVTDNYDVISPDLGVRNKCDANLIACAPEMYHALNDIVKLGLDDDCKINIDSLKQLLAKARGEL